MLPLSALIAYNTYRNFVADREAATVEAARLAEITAIQTAQIVRDAQSLLVALSQRPQIRALDRQRCDPLFRDFLDLHARFANLLIVNTAANIVCSAATPAPGVTKVLPEFWLRRLIETDRFTIGKPTKGLITGKWVVVLAHPLHDDAGKLIGAVALPISLGNFQPLVGLATLPPGFTARIISDEGIVIAGSNTMRTGQPGTRIGEDVRGTAIVDIILARKQGHARSTGSDGTERLYGFRPIPGTGWYASAGIPVSAVYADVQMRVLQNVLIGLLLALVAVALATIAARRILDPVRAMAGTARALAQGRLEARFQVTGPAEIDEVETQFNDALDTLEKEQRALVEKDTRLVQLIAAVGDGIISVDEQLRIVIVNPAAEQIFGRPAAEMIGAPLNMLLPERFRARHDEHIREFTVTRLTNRAMGRYGLIYGLRADGTEFPVEATISQSGESPNKLLTVVLRDVTERLRAEQSLRDSERFTRATMDALQANICVLDAAGTIIAVNQAWRDFAAANGAEPATVSEGTNYLAVCAAATGAGDTTAAAFADKVRGVARDGTSRFSLEYPCDSPREPRWFVALFSRFQFEDTVRIVIAHVDITERKALEQTLRSYSDQMRLLSRRLFDVEENERRQLARELHDRIGQNVTALSIGLNTLRSELPADWQRQLKEHLDDCETLLFSTSTLVRNVMNDLRPPGLEELGLAAALGEFARQIGRRTGIAVTVTGSEERPRLPELTAIALFRIAQEALTNITKHARATTVSIALESTADALIMTITDDGCGFDASAPRARPSASLGMVGMRERAEAIGGRLRVESAPGQGTRVIVEAPRVSPDSRDQPSLPGIGPMQDLGAWTPSKNNRKEEE